MQAPARKSVVDFLTSHINKLNEEPNDKNRVDKIVSSIKGCIIDTLEDHKSSSTLGLFGHFSTPEWVNQLRSVKRDESNLRYIKYSRGHRNN